MTEFQSISQLEEAPEPPFKEIYGNVGRILALTDAPDLMSLGPTIVDRDSAIEDGWLESADDFRAMLRASTVPEVRVEINGTEYTSARFFFKLGGNRAAAKKWLGDIHFRHGGGELEYTFHTDGRIMLTKRSSDTRWIDYCLAEAKEKRELNGALIKIKEHLHTRKLGAVSLV